MRVEQLQAEAFRRFIEWSGRVLDYSKYPTQLPEEWLEKYHDLGYSPELTAEILDLALEARLRMYRTYMREWAAANDVVRYTEIIRNNTSHWVIQYRDGSTTLKIWNTSLEI